MFADKRAIGIIPLQDHDFTPVIGQVMGPAVGVGSAMSFDEGHHPSQVLGRDYQHDHAREQQTQHAE